MFRASSCWQMRVRACGLEEGSLRPVVSIFYSSPQGLKQKNLGNGSDSVLEESLEKIKEDRKVSRRMIKQMVQEGVKPKVSSSNLSTMTARSCFISGFLRLDL